MRNLKKELREKLRAEKKQNLELRKELSSIPKDSPRATEIRKLLGIATLQDILGDKYPKRICKHCGKRAYNDLDLLGFKHNTCCLACSIVPDKSKIVGLHSLITKQQVCEVCARPNSGIGRRSWFTHGAKVCKSCLGTHIEMFGYPLKLDIPKPLAYQGITFTTYTELAKLLDLPYTIARYRLISNQIKDITWIT